MLLLFCSGTVKRKKRTFSRLILDTAYSFFLPPYSFQIRVGGLYLLYSLYQCQTASPSEQVRNTQHTVGQMLNKVLLLDIQSLLCFWLQIRLALKDWEEVKKFEKDAVDAQHLDVVYIFRQLMALKAFSFTAMPTQVSC